MSKFQMKEMEEKRKAMMRSSTRADCTLGMPPTYQLLLPGMVLATQRTEYTRRSQKYKRAKVQWFTKQGVQNKGRRDTYLV